MPIEKFNKPPHHIGLVKSRAKAIKRSEKITHSAALEAAAREAGYRNWHECRRALEN